MANNAQATNQEHWEALVNPFLDAQNMLNDLFVDVQRNSLIPGARSIKTFDPSRRTRGSYGLGDALIPPRTT